MAQQRLAGAVAQRQADLADAAGRRRPHRRRAVELSQPFIIGKTRNAEVALRDALDAQKALFPDRAEQRQARAGVDIQQLVDQRGDKRGLAAAAKAGNGQTQVPVNATVDQRIEFSFKSLHCHPMLSVIFQASALKKVL